MLETVSATRQLRGVTTQALEGAPASATLSVVTSLAALRELEHKWHDLETQAQYSTSVFQSFDWSIAWAETYIGNNAQTTLHILAGYDEDELVFLWPLMRVKRFGFSVLTWLTEPFGKYGDVICKKGHCPRQWISGSISFLRRLNDIDIVRLRHVRADGHLASQKDSPLFDARVPEKAPHLDLTLFATEEAYDQRYTPVQRKRRKKIRKGLENLGPVAFERLPSGSLADTAMAQAIAEKNQWLAERGRMNLVLGCKGHLSFLKLLSRRRNGSLDMVVTQMKAGDKAVSWEVGFRHQGIHYGYITSHLNALTDLSPARLHMDQSQRQALRDGMTRFDLMVPNDAHKESWSSAAIDTNDLYLPLSPFGAIFGHGYLRTIRPLLRKIYYSLEGSALRKFSMNPFGKRNLKPTPDA
jgi:CelD/BcsL family acetyltransferase involved in cellulose biosynthesis